MSDWLRPMITRINFPFESRVIVDDTATPEEDEDHELRRLESFLYGLTASTIEFRLPLKMKRLLSKYRARKAKETQRKLEVISHSELFMVAENGFSSFNSGLELINRNLIRIKTTRMTTRQWRRQKGHWVRIK